jgi:hypothetical protein
MPGCRLLNRKSEQMRLQGKPFRKAVLERAMADPRFNVTLDQLDRAPPIAPGEYTVIWRGEKMTEYQYRARLELGGAR